MSVFDTFFLLFKTDASQAKAELESLDKEILKITASGKKRSEQENKDLKEKIERQKELASALKNSGNASGNLVDSLGAAAAAIISFGAIRSGIINVSEFNSGLEVQSKLLGQNAKDLETLSHAAKLAGGTSEGALGDLARVSSYLTKMTGRTVPIDVAFATAQKDLSQFDYDKDEKRRQLAKRYTDKGYFTDAGLQSMLLDPSEYQKRLAQSSQQINDKNSDYSRDREIQSRVASIDKNTQGLFDKISRAFPDSWSAFAQSGIGGSALGGLGLLATWFGGKKIIGGLLRVGVNGVRLGAGAVAGAGAAGSAVIGAGMVAGYGLADAAINPQDNMLRTAGNKFWTWMDKNHPSFVPDSKKGKPIKSQMGEIDYLMSKGLTRQDAAVIVGQMNAENPKRDLNARGDGGIAHGYMQWQNNSKNGYRRDKIKQATGIDVSTQGGTAQLDAILWEMQNGDTGFDFDKFKKLGTIAEKSAYMSKTYVRHRGSEYHSPDTMRRIGYASSAYSNGAMQNSSNQSVQIDRIDVHTQATDAKGISNAIGSELHNTLRKVNTHFDDGEKY